MVPVEKENAYQLREYLHLKVSENAHADPFKSSFLHFLGMSKDGAPSFDFEMLSLYQRCAIAGLGVLDKTVSGLDVSRLLGQAAKIDSTPRPWVSDMFGVMAVKWLVGQMNDARIAREFENWISGFLAQQVSSDHLNLFEKDIAAYVRISESADDINRGALRGENQVDACSAGFLCQASDQFLNFLTGDHHEVGKLIDHNHNEGQCRQRYRTFRHQGIGIIDRATGRFRFADFLVKACKVAYTEHAHQPVAALHFRHTPVQGIGCRRDVSLGRRSRSRRWCHEGERNGCRFNGWQAILE